MKANNVLITGGTSGFGEYFADNYPTSAFNIHRNEDPKTRIETFVEKYGKINAFIHFAGIAYTESIDLFNREKFDRIMWSNVGLAMEIIKTVKKRKYSENLSIVLFGSVAGMKGAPGISMYAASKAAIIGLTKSLACELAPQNIRVNCISPGHVKGTRMSTQNEQIIGKEGFKKIEDLHRLGFGAIQDVYNLVEFLINNDRWITGQNLVIDGGYTA